MTKDDAKQIVAGLLGVDEGDGYMAGLVMLAPLVTNSFHPDIIAVRMGINGQFCRAVVERLKRNRIWGDKCFYAKWPEIFTKKGRRRVQNDNDFASLMAVSFIVEALVAEGAVARFDSWKREQDFLYSYAADKYEHGIKGSALTEQLRSIGKRRAAMGAASSAFKQLDLSPGSGVFVDLGCGDSCDARLARELGYASFGIDLFQPSAPSDFVRANICALPLRRDSVDVAVCQAVLDLVRPDERATAWAEMGRVLKPGGQLAVYVQSLRNGWGITMNGERERAEAAGFRSRSASGLCLMLERLPVVKAVKPSLRAGHEAPSSAPSPPHHAQHAGRKPNQRAEQRRFDAHRRGAEPALCSSCSRKRCCTSRRSRLRPRFRRAISRSRYTFAFSKSCNAFPFASQRATYLITLQSDQPSTCPQASSTSIGSGVRRV